MVSVRPESKSRPWFCSFFLYPLTYKAKNASTALLVWLAFMDWWITYHQTNIRFFCYPFSLEEKTYRTPINRQKGLWKHCSYKPQLKTLRRLSYTKIRLIILWKSMSVPNDYLEHLRNISAAFLPFHVVRG